MIDLFYLIISVNYLYFGCPVYFVIIFTPRKYLKIKCKIDNYLLMLGSVKDIRVE